MTASVVDVTGAPRIRVVPADLPLPVRPRLAARSRLLGDLGAGPSRPRCGGHRRERGIGHHASTARTHLGDDLLFATLGALAIAGFDVAVNVWLLVWWVL